MGNTPLLAYIVARRNAADLDRRGIPPNLLIRIVVGVACVASCAMGLVVAFVGMIFLAGMLGLYPG